MLTNEERAQAIEEAKRITTQHAEAVQSLFWPDVKGQYEIALADPRFKAVIDFTVDAYRAAFQAAASRLIDERLKPPAP